MNQAKFLKNRKVRFLEPNFTRLSSKSALIRKFTVQPNHGSVSDSE